MDTDLTQSRHNARPDLLMRLAVTLDDSGFIAQAEGQSE
jgi:hypothetical protein